METNKSKSENDQENTNQNANSSYSGSGSIQPGDSTGEDKELNDHPNKKRVIQ